MIYESEVMDGDDSHRIAKWWQNEPGPVKYVDTTAEEFGMWPVHVLPEGV
jgi:hypothetical protein